MTGPDQRRQGVLHRVAAVGHYPSRVESSQRASEAQGEWWMESLRSLVAPGEAESHIDPHFGWAVEETH